MKSYILAKPRTRFVQGTEYGTLDVAVVNGEWLAFESFEDAYDYWRSELALDSRYFILEWVGWEGGRIASK